MKALPFLATALALVATTHADPDLRKALTFHASFDRDLNADFSRGEKTGYLRKGQEVVPAQVNEEVRIVHGAGRFGGALHFTKKGTTRPQYPGAGVLDYHAQTWSRSVSVWLRLDPDQDLEPGYCDPVQIVGEDIKKGFIFLEWSKDHTPRRFRYAIRPLIEIWNPTAVGWEEIADAKRPMVQLSEPVFSREKWTHIVFTLENINDSAKKPAGRLYVNGAPKGAIEGWDLRLGWDPAKVLLVLGAAYVGHMDDLAVFDRTLTAPEVQKLFALPRGVAELHP